MSNIAYLKRYRRVYLASPYTKYEAGPEAAFRDICVVAAKLMKAGVYLFCPITHCHPIATYGGIDPFDDPFWCDQIRGEQDDTDALVITMLKGWDDSDGIKGETAHAYLRVQPIHYLDPVRMVLTR